MAGTVGRNLDDARSYKARNSAAPLRFGMKRLVSADKFIGAAVVVVIAAISCSTRDDAPDVTPNSVSTSPSAPIVVLETAVVPSTDAVAPDSEAFPDDVEACPTGTIVIKAEDFVGVDPARYDFGSSFPYELVYSRLFRIDAESGEIEPDLVVSYTVSADGRTYTFRLRDDVRYSDGSPLAASDVQFSFARTLIGGPATTSRYVLGGIEGASDLVNGDATELRGVTIVDDLTIEIRLGAPDWDFVDKLTHPIASIVSEGNAGQWASEWARRVAYEPSSGYPFPAFPIGTGPLKVEELRQSSDRATYTPNIHHWSDPLRPRIVQRSPYYADGLGNLPAYDEFDIFEVGRGVAFSFDRGFPKTYDGEPLIGYDLVVSERIPEVAFFAFNTAIEPFDDVQFRRALLAAADNRELGYLVSVPARRDVATGLLSPNMDGFVARDALEPDRATATEIAETSPYSESQQSLSVSLWVTDSLTPFDIDIITRFWTRWLGLDVEVWGMKQTDFGYTISAEHIEGYEARLVYGTLPMRFVEVQPTRNSPEEVLGLFRNLFGANAVSPEVEELNAMLDAAAAESDVAKRIRLYTEIEEHILDRALAIPIAWGSPTKWEVVREWIDGYQPSQYVPLNLSGVTVDTTHPDYPADRPCN